MDYREELAFFSQLLEQKGFVNALEGNISLCDRENGRIYITPSQHMKLRLTPQTVCVLDMDGNQLSGKFPRTSEFFLHQAIYRSYPTKSAVIHSHCPYLTAYALLERDFVLPEKTPLRKAFSRLVCLPYGKAGTHEVHQGIGQALLESPVCLLGGHGVVSTADTLENAAGYLEAAEGFAQTLYLARQFPGCTL